MDQSHNDGSESPPLQKGDEGNQGGLISPDEFQGHRRRRSHQSGSRGRESHSGDRFRGGGSRGSRGHRRGGLTPKQRVERLILVACCGLFLVLVGLVGFMFGKRSALSQALSMHVEHVDVVQPTAASDVLLDEAFGELNEGHPKKALHAFEKIQELQPSLTGIHYLIGYAAQNAGESSLAAEALQRSLDRREMMEESRLLLAVIHLSQVGSGAVEGAHLSDPLTDAESEFRRFAASNPVDAGVYYQWAEILRSRGSYRTAAELLHRGILRSLITTNPSFLSAKEALTRLQSDPSKVSPSLSGITSMSGESAFGAALGSLQTQKSSEALSFLERARELYSPAVFYELMKDPAFYPYRSDPKLRGVLSMGP